MPAHARDLHFVPFDLSEIDGIPELVRALKAEHGPLYGLVNNAALGTEGLLSNMHNSDIEKLVRVNTLSPIVLTKYAVRGMMTAGEGRIVNISSIIASTGYSGLVGLWRHQGVDAGLHPQPGPRSGPAGCDGQRGGAGLHGHRNDRRA